MKVDNRRRISVYAYVHNVALSAACQDCTDELCDHDTGGMQARSVT